MSFLQFKAPISVISICNINWLVCGVEMNCVLSGEPTHMVTNGICTSKGSALYNGTAGVKRLYEVMCETSVIMQCCYPMILVHQHLALYPTGISFAVACSVVSFPFCP